MRRIGWITCGLRRPQVDDRVPLSRTNDTISARTLFIATSSVRPISAVEIASFESPRPPRD